MKAQALADDFVEKPVNGGYEPLDTYFSDEDINSLEEVVQMEINPDNCTSIE